MRPRTNETGGADRTGAPDPKDGRRGRHGFSIIEILVAIVILTLGILAMASSTGFMATQIRMAGLHSERVAAQQRAIERLYSYPYDEVPVVDHGSAETFGSFQVWWDTVSVGEWAVKQVTIYTEGPGYSPGSGWNPAVQDTLPIRLTRPYP